MGSVEVRKRQSEIETCIQNNDLDMATKRSMDFVTDFSTDKKKRREAINIRATYSTLRIDHRQFGSSIEIENRFKRIREQILEFIDEIECEYKKNDEVINNIFEPPSLKNKKNIDKELVTLTSYEEEKELYKNKDKTFKKNEHKKIVFYAKEVTKSYKSNSIKFSFKPINLSLKYGSITTLVGKNGNGKSTLLNIVASELLPSSGKIMYPELIRGNKKNLYHIKTQIAYIKQELPEWQGLLKDNLHFTLGINGIGGKENIDEVDFIIHRLGLEKYAEAKWNEISGGFKMRFSLARAILRKPKLLILDEPLANLDINTQNLFLTDLRDLANSLKNRMSVIISSQNLYEVEEIADNIIFLNDGSTVYNGKVENFGKDRTENTYETNIAISEDNLLSILESVDYINVTKDGKNYIINTKRSVTSKILLELFLDNNISVKYFRDISKSTRKLFEEFR